MARLAMGGVKSSEKTSREEGVDGNELPIIVDKELYRREGSAVVWRGRDMATGSIVVVKKVVDAFRSDSDAQRVFREIM